MKRHGTVMKIWLLALSIAMFGCLCGGGDKSEKVKKKTERWEKPATTEDGKPAVKEDTRKKKPKDQVTDGSEFNRAFPKDGYQDMKRVFTKEKDGYAEADYKKDGKVEVTVSVSDTGNNARALKKFDKSTEKIDGFPYIARGKNNSFVLVNKKYQVRVSSKTQDEKARKKWLSKFQLKKLAGM